MAGDPIESLKSALADRYAIERELGRGGYSVVYLAHDVRHDRKVALKVLQPELALAVRHERFLREIQIAAKLSHPHILPLHDSGEAGGTVYYVMPYVEGESLRDRLNREKQLPVDVALAITHDVAAALGHAHAQGVVHRDIKPENTLLTGDGKPVVMDFGIARALTVATGQAVTEGGIAVGTPAYMSPEQAGGGEVDGRSDIYALGCVLYEMLAGHPPFTGATAQEILARHALDPVPTVRAARPTVPEAVERAVFRAMSKAPVDRFPSGGGFSAALSGSATVAGLRPHRRWAYAAIVAAILTVGLALSMSRPADERSVGVLPCLYLGDPDNQYFGEGMAEELISSLSRVAGLRVPALTSSLAVARPHLSATQAAVALDVASLLQCTVRRTGGRLRVSARLVRRRDEAVLWSDTYDRKLSSQRDEIEVQEEIARAIVAALPTGRSSPAIFSSRRYTIDTLASQLYFRGQHFARKRTAESYQTAKAFFQQAIQRDSTFALAYAGLAAASVSAGASGWVPRADAYTLARVAATKAVALDSTLPQAHAALARVLYFGDWNWQAAEQAYRRAIDLDSNLSEARGTYAQLLAVTGRLEDAVLQAAKAAQLDPQTADPTIAGALSYARRHEEAIAEIQRMHALVPDSPQGVMGRIYLNAGRLDKAIATLELTRVLRGGTLEGGVAGQLAYAYARSDRPEDAQKILSDLRTRPATDFRLMGLAWAYLGLGDRDKAIEAYVAAADRHAGNPGLLADPAWDEVRGDPRVKAMRIRLSLEP